MIGRVMPEQILLAVRLDQRDPFRAAPRQSQIVERDPVDREEPARRAVLRRHVPERRAVGQRQRSHALAEVLDELPDDTGVAQDLRHGQHEIGRSRALGQRSAQLEPDHLRHEHRKRLPEHRGLRLDPTGAPTEHAQPVDHCRMRVRADERVGERNAVAVVDDASEVLEVHLVADACARWHDLEAAQRLLAPTQEEVALVVALELELDVATERHPRRERVDLHGVVDHELGRDQRVDLRRVAAEVGHRVSHRGQVDHRGDACQVLEKDAGRRERDLVRGLGLRIPARDRLDIGLVTGSQDVLEQDAKRVGKARDVVRGLQFVEAVDPIRAVSDFELSGRGHFLDSTRRAAAAASAP